MADLTLDEHKARLAEMLAAMAATGRKPRQSAAVLAGYLRRYGLPGAVATLPNGTNVIVWEGEG